MRRLLPTLFALALAGATPAAAQIAEFASARPARAYQLEKGSGFSEGCFDPCMCPIFWSDDLTGQFKVTHAGIEDGFRVFRVTDVVLETGRLGRGAKGTGVYRIALEKRFQRLELDLVGSHGVVEHFDSGLVPLTVPFPRIEIAVSRNKMVCYDTVYHIAAAPVLDRRRPTLGTLSDSDTPVAVTWGRIKSLYRD